MWPHTLMLLSHHYLTLVMIYDPPRLHGHGGGGVLVYWSTQRGRGSLNTKYYCDSMHYVCVLCVQGFCFSTKRMTFVTIRRSGDIGWKEILIGDFSVLWPSFSSVDRKCIKNSRWQNQKPRPVVNEVKCKQVLWPFIRSVSSRPVETNNIID